MRRYVTSGPRTIADVWRQGVQSVQAAREKYGSLYAPRQQAAPTPTTPATATVPGATAVWSGGGQPAAQAPASSFQAAPGAPQLPGFQTQQQPGTGFDAQQALGAQQAQRPAGPGTPVSGQEFARRVLVIAKALEDLMPQYKVGWQGIQYRQEHGEWPNDWVPRVKQIIDTLGVVASTAAQGGVTAGGRTYLAQHRTVGIDPITAATAVMSAVPMLRDFLTGIFGGDKGVALAPLPTEAVQREMASRIQRGGETENDRRVVRALLRIADELDQVAGLTFPGSTGTVDYTRSYLRRLAQYVRSSLARHVMERRGRGYGGSWDPVPPWKLHVQGDFSKELWYQFAHQQA